MRSLILILALNACANPVYEVSGGPIDWPDGWSFVPPEPIAPEGSEAVRVCLPEASAELPELAAAVAGWQRSAGAWRGFELVADRCELTVEERDPSDWPCEPGFVGCATAIGGADLLHPRATVYLQLTKYELYARMVLMHEIGHALGLPHENGTLMQANPTRHMWNSVWECPDPETINQLELHLGVTNLVSCEMP